MPSPTVDLPELCNEQNEQTVRCPTCRAEQPLSGQCRRCKCDLQLVRQAYRLIQNARTQCLRHLRDGRFAQAVDQARTSHRLHPTDDSGKLLAVCCLLAGQWDDALKTAAAVAVQSVKPA